MLLECNTWASSRRLLSEQSVQVLIWSDKTRVAEQLGGGKKIYFN